MDVRRICSVVHEMLQLVNAGTGRKKHSWNRRPYAAMSCSANEFVCKCKISNESHCAWVSNPYPQLNKRYLRYVHAGTGTASTCSSLRTCIPSHKSPVLFEDGDPGHQLSANSFRYSASCDHVVYIAGAATLEMCRCE